MGDIIHLFVLIPFVAFLVSLLIPGEKEALLSRVALVSIGINLLLSLCFSVWWLITGAERLNFQDIALYEDKDFDYYIDFLFDEITATYLIVGNIISFMVVTYSRYYMHREEGYKRFFNTILLFWSGYTLTILSGNFGTLFIGWEILGISSFLLIAFYRLRYLPVKNALKVFTIYRIGDIGILLAMWGSHHLWQENILFIRMHNHEQVSEMFHMHSGMSIFISLMILIAALAKSAQLPFSAWLPRAMEGPTPSSAIFYGSLSVHIGAFLLLRTYPFWEHQIFIRILIGFIGLCTAIITTMIARVQSTVKGQIAYSSASQIGIIFIEIASGFDIMALIHFAGNAFLRSYQLLTSPSVVSYLIREQFYNSGSKPLNNSKSFIYSVRNSLYVLSLKEWYLDSLIFIIVFRPLKKMRGILGFLTVSNVLCFLFPLFFIGLYIAYNRDPAFGRYYNYCRIAAALLALLMVIKAYNERGSTRLAWLLVLSAHFFVYLAVTFNEHVDAREVTIYLSGIIVSGVAGYICLHRIKAFEQRNIGLNQFHGMISRYRAVSYVFLLACLGVAGFPITTTFLGEDIILSHIHSNQVILAMLVSLTFIINGIAVIRIYARVFLGNTERNYQDESKLTL